jgi:hypothetical protein
LQNASRRSTCSPPLPRTRQARIQSHHYPPPPLSPLISSPPLSTPSPPALPGIAISHAIAIAQTPPQGSLRRHLHHQPSTLHFDGPTRVTPSKSQRCGFFPRFPPLYHAFFLICTHLFQVEVGPSSFQKIKILGRGDVGRVFLVREKKTSKLYAMKGGLPLEYCAWTCRLLTNEFQFSQRRK